MAVPLALDRSLGGRRWRLRAADEAIALALSQRFGLPDVLGRILAARGITPASAPAFLEPRLRKALPEPSHLLDLDRAAARLALAIEREERIGLLADYDVDGATSCALLLRYLAAAGGRAVFDIPDRLREGYGPNPAALDRLAKQGCRLIVVLDAGTTAFAPLEHAAARGLEVIVVDHHAAEPRLPPALAVVNPNRCDQASAVGHLAAVGVTFLLVVALNRLLRARGGFARRPEPDLRRWLDLVALGTVCDLVPLTGLNRALVAQGMKVAAQAPNPGLAALAGAARVSVLETTEQLGFQVGPRLNAGGRTGRSDLGARLLASDAPDEVAALAVELDRLNQIRQAQERAVLAEAEAALGPALAAAQPLLLAAGAGWSPGVAGIVAARLVELYHRPAIVIGLDGALGKGSGRSIPGFDLGRAVIAARQAGLVRHGGGHPMAAGLTVEAAQIPALQAFLRARLDEALAGAPPRPPDLQLDGVLEVGAVSVPLVDALRRLAPFGPGNPEPRLLLPEVRLHAVRPIGTGHLDCWLADRTGARLRAVAFRVAATPLGQALLADDGALWQIAGRAKVDHWQGRTRVSFQIEDGARA
jgi:single-stranded-DNA-specific exonuclease